jgi:hypothetical protein
LYRFHLEKLRPKHRYPPGSAAAPASNGKDERKGPLYHTDSLTANLKWYEKNWKPTIDHYIINPQYY